MNDAAARCGVGRFGPGVSGLPVLRQKSNPKLMLYVLRSSECFLAKR